jgi:peptidoglycan-associated lipoprotein
MPMKILGALFAVLMLAACGSETNPGTAGAVGAATPGSIAEFQSAAVGDKVYFAFDSAELAPDARATLDKQAAWLRQYGSRYKVTVEGHCDERGTREYNLALGARRASAVKNYLVAQGISDGSLATISYGKERPEAQGGDESAWSRNRRGVTALQ